MFYILIMCETKQFSSKFDQRFILVENNKYAYFSQKGKKLKKNNIRITYPCDLYPLTNHFYIVKFWFTGVDIIFLFLLLNIDCGYSLEPPQRGGFNAYPKSMF